MKKHGLKKSNPSIYNLWKDIKRRGSVCEEWLSFPEFLKWAENKWSKGLCLILIDNSKIYSPDNCKFVTRKELSKISIDRNKEIILEKTKKTCLERYGVEHHSQLDNIKEKKRKTCLKNHGVEHGVNTLKAKKLANSKESKKKRVQTAIDKGYIKLYDGKTLKEIYHLSNKTYSTFCNQAKKRGFDYAFNDNKGKSYLPIVITQWLDEIKIEYQEEIKINNYFADILIPEYNLVIETDGVYWHSDAIQKDNKYHVKKRQAYLDEGYSSLFFREDEINNKLDIVKSIIKNKIGLAEKKVYARKCKIISLSSEQAAKFFNENHLMCKGQGKATALEYEGDLVAAIQTKKRGGGIEVSRFCSKLGYSVIGGLSKLLAIIKERPIISFVDLRYGDGHSLEKLGFARETCYPSFKWADLSKDILHHRSKFPGNSGYEYGLVKIWDCGQAKFVKYA